MEGSGDNSGGGGGWLQETDDRNGNIATAPSTRMLCVSMEKNNTKIHNHRPIYKSSTKYMSKTEKRN